MTTSPNEPTRRRSLYYDGLRERVRSRVLAGQAGDRLPADIEFAKEIGTSKITIGQILQELQVEGFVQRIPGKGTFLLDRSKPQPTLMAPLTHVNESVVEPPTVAVTHSHSVAACVLVLAVLDLPWHKGPRQDDWSHRVAMSVEHHLQRGGVPTIVRNRFAVEVEDIDGLIVNAVRAGANRIVYVTGSLPEQIRMATWANQVVSLSQRGAGQALPVVQVAFDATFHLPLNAVGVDGEYGSQIATQHLISLGHRNIVFAAPSAAFSNELQWWISDRVCGFRRALQMAGIDPPVLLERASQIMDTPRIVRSESPVEWELTGRSVAHRILADPSITAVVAANDQVAMGLMDEVKKLGKRVPEDLSIVGYDNHFASAASDLTTVHVPVEQIGEAAGTMVLEPLSDNLGHKKRILLDPMLVVRGSTGPPRTTA